MVQVMVQVMIPVKALVADGPEHGSLADTQSAQKGACHFVLLIDLHWLHSAQIESKSD